MDRDIMAKIREVDPQIPVVLLYTPEKKDLLDEFIPLLPDGFIKTTFDKKQFNTVLGKALKPVFYKKEIKKKDMLLFQRSKFSALGEMIENIAHQWRQPLHSIGATMMKLEFEYEHDICTPANIKDSVEKTNAILLHMSKTIDDFRNFFEPNKEKELFKLDDALQSVYALLNPQLMDYNIQLKTTAKTGIRIFGHSNELKQVLINIINNAKDAIIMNKIPNGKIILDIENDKKNVTIKIKDNGRGIPEKVIKNIFEPYFTTKFESKGTGIGLYMSKIIIEKNMKGSISVSNIKNGAEFKISLPRGKDLLKIN